MWSPVNHFFLQSLKNIEAHNKTWWSKHCVEAFVEWIEEKEFSEGPWCIDSITSDNDHLTIDCIIKNGTASDELPCVEDYSKQIIKSSDNLYFLRACMKVVLNVHCMWQIFDEIFFWKVRIVEDLKISNRSPCARWQESLWSVFTPCIPAFCV